ncbi:uncharacterized protein TrAtP1_000476 [Trichoderma atroviride]|uniref:uncharacterized protein n=1 Tax=Hypocrea atroviridis TaxID=63577 RepID=UPI003322C779|nr:hypothetical protein TrAtP1_000476 [Trichoderma atroviride]
MIWSDIRTLTTEGSFNRCSTPVSSANSVIEGAAVVIGNMLSVNFSTPLNGPARSERIKQMSNNHPAFEKSRITQEILVKIQHSLRRMPGVAANESNEIIQRLIEVGQVISQETSALVEAVMNLHLDQEDTDKAIARMSIEANLAKAHADDQAQRINSLEEELRQEKKRREDTEENLKNMIGGIADITTEFKQLRDKADRQKTDLLSKGLPFSDGDFLIRSLDNTIHLLEDEISKQHSLWTVQQQPNSNSIPRTIEPSPEHVQVTNGHRKPLVPLQEEEVGNGSIFSDPVTSPRPATAFQPAQRPPTVGPPPKFGQFQGNMPPRPTTALPHDRRTANAWNPVAPMQGGRQGSFNHRPQFQGPHSGRAPLSPGFSE